MYTIRIKSTNHHGTIIYTAETVRREPSPFTPYVCRCGLTKDEALKALQATLVQLADGLREAARDIQHGRVTDETK